MKEDVVARDQEVHQLIKKEERVGKKITTIQSTIQEKETAITVSQLVSAVKDETQFDEEQELQLLDFLQLSAELVELKENLLEVKEEKWDLERRIRSATSESAQLKEKLADMESEVVSSQITY